MTKILSVLLSFMAFGALAADRVTMNVVVTNPPMTGFVLVVNGAFRIFTNASSSTTILTNLVDVNGSATNVFNDYADFPVGSGIIPQWLNTNEFRFVAPFGTPLSGSVTGAWATLTLHTQAGPATYTALWPLENIGEATNRTNQASALVYGLSAYSTNAFATNATATSNFITKGTTAGGIQTIASGLKISGATRVSSGLYATNGFLSAVTNINPVLSNAVNYGTAFSSPGDYPGVQQFGAGGSAATGGNATILGTSSTAATNGVAVGWFSSAGYFGIALGASSDGSPSTNSIVIGRNSNIGASSNAVALGNEINIADRHHNSIAIGFGATTTTNDQVVLGASTHTVIVPGMIQAGTFTNGLFKGTNRIDARLDLIPATVTSLANGYNTAIAITRAYMRFSGPSAAYTNAGFLSDSCIDGTSSDLQFDNPGLSFTILHESGLTGDTNRIYTGTGALLNSTNNPVFVRVIRDGAVSRWRIISFR